MKKQEMKGLKQLTAPDGYDPLAVQAKLQDRILLRFPDSPVLAAEGTVGEAAMVAYLNAMAVNVELGELLDHIPEWKWWKGVGADASLTAYDEEHDGAVTEAKYELVDALHFILNIAIALGMDWQELMDIFYTKQSENFDRQDRSY
jgi:dimeric dUTPase (all-alpha-NTP-PPase superfamily)